ncbi:MAG: D-alanyl-D-alanine carboxypeptidase [Polyangiales bacterium]
MGIAVDGEAHLGPRPADAPLLEEHLSPPLARLAQLLGKESDNFAAEMLTKALGRAKGDTGSTATGLRAITEALAPLHLGDAVRLENGSGLFGESRATPASVTAALAAGALDAAIAPEFLAAFAVAGRDGTLKGRLGDVPAGRVRAKTGTLRNVSALSGWVLDVRGEPRFAFSVLANDVGGKIDSAKRLADGVVRALVRASDARTAGETAR